MKKDMKPLRSIDDVHEYVESRTSGKPMCDMTGETNELVRCFRCEWYVPDTVRCRRTGFKVNTEFDEKYGMGSFGFCSWGVPRKVTE